MDQILKEIRRRGTRNNNTIVPAPLGIEPNIEYSVKPRQTTSSMLYTPGYYYRAKTDSTGAEVSAYQNDYLRSTATGKNGRYVVTR